MHSFTRLFSTVKMYIFFFPSPSCEVNHAANELSNASYYNKTPMLFDKNIKKKRKKKEKDMIGVVFFSLFG